MTNEGAAVIETLRREGITQLYHFTSIENLPRISQIGALCSKEILDTLGHWPVVQPGGNVLSRNLDRNRGNWDKLSIYYTPYTPMAYHKKRERHICYFVLSSEAAAIPGTTFTDTNATANDHHRDVGLAGLKLVNFTAIKSLPRPGDRLGWHRPVQAEVLIPGRVPLELVKEVAFCSPASPEEGLRMWGPNARPKFVIAPALFADDPRHRGSLPYPHVKQLFVTDAPVTRENVWQKQPVTQPISQSRLAFVAEVYVLAGAVARTVWLPSGQQGLHTFATGGSKRHWGRASQNSCSAGINQLRYELNDLRWTTIEFEVGS